MTTDSDTAKKNLTLLAKVRDDCAEQIMNGDLTLADRNAFSERHQQLREIIDKFSHERFHEISIGFKNTEALKITTKALKDRIVELESVRKNAETTQEVLNILDQVIQCGTTLGSLLI